MSPEETREFESLKSAVRELKNDVERLQRVLTGGRPLAVIEMNPIDQRITEIERVFQRLRSHD